MPSTCKCIIDGFKMRDDLGNLRSGLMEGRSIDRFINNSIEIMKKTEIDCGTDLDRFKDNVKEIKEVVDSGKILLAVNKLDDMLNPNNEKSLLSQLEKC